MSIEIKGLSKSYGKLRALDNIDLSFGGEKIYGLLGRNGAGKTTLLNLITGRLFPDSGEVTIDGRPLDHDGAAARLVFMTGEASLYPESMRVSEIFRWTREFYPNFDAAEAEGLARDFGLPLRRRFKGLSTGYQSIVKLICALCVGTPYLVFDEPILGLDANNRDLFYRKLITLYAERPATIIISTHLIEEVSSIVEDVAIIKDGRILRACSRDELLSEGYTVSGSAAVVDRYIEGKNVLGVDTLGSYKSACLLGKPGELPEGLELSRLDLQQLFIRLTNS